MAAASPEAENVPPQLNGTIAGRFTVERLLGAGGMGEVYLARDTLLKRPVALKRVSARWRAEPQQRKRLMREAERSSALSHANIAGVYDVLEVSGEFILVMEYVAGITLRERMKAPFNEAAFRFIAEGCAAAVAAAHRHGIVHGDLKPENIMLVGSARDNTRPLASQPLQHAQDCGVKVLDFGLATSLRSEPDAVTESHEVSRDGIRGTAGYIAPEVLRGNMPQPPADVFSLGVTFYEVLNGSNPFSGPTLTASLERTLFHQPKKLSQEASFGFCDVIAKMLAKDAAQRYADGGAVAKALETHGLQPAAIARGWRPALVGAVIGLLAILVAGIVLVPKRPQPRPSGLPGHSVVAVLPFRAIGGAQDLDALGQGLAETATARLTRVTPDASAQIVPTSEVRSHHLGDDVDRARKDLGVDLAVTGSLERRNDRIRINYALVETNTKRQVRADSVEAAAADAFTLEDRTVEGILAMLNLQMRPAEKDRTAEHGTTDPGAYANYLLGVGYLRGYDDPKNIASAVEAFQRALAADQNDGLAYAGLGEAYWRQYLSTHDAALIGRASEMCNRAATRAPRLAPAHVCLGILEDGAGQYSDAVQQFSSAISFDPNSDEAYRGLASAFEHLSKPQEAEATFQRAIEVRPQYWGGYAQLGRFYVRQARYEDAAREYAAAAQAAPGNSAVLTALAGIYIYLGSYNQAVAACHAAIAAYPRYEAYSNLGYAYLRQRDFDGAIRAFEQAQLLGAQDYNTWGSLADAYYYAPGKRELARAKYQQAARLAQSALKVNPNDHAAHILLAHYQASLGERTAAMAQISAAMADQEQDKEVLYYAALVANQLGDKARASKWLRAALENGYSSAEIKSAIEFDNLRGMPEYQALFSGAR